MERTSGHPRLSLATLKLLLKPQPCTGESSVDIIFLFFVGALHSTILPSIFGRYLLIDLMTPWLVCTFVAAPLTRSIILAILGALILETHSATPAGLYIVAYWIIMAALWLARSTLSWRHVFPWAVTFFVSELWVIAFETFVMAVSEGVFQFNPIQMLNQCLRLGVATVFGLALCRRFMSLGVGEETA
jgi:hypothetical protein